MTHQFEELDYRKTPLGELVLRRRQSPSVSDWVYEVTLDHEMLMSSSVNVSEKELARIALNPRKEQPVDVLVGGLGLGYTAAAALEYPNLRQLVVVELLEPVIAWHRNRLVPLAETLIEDPRCALVEGDFFDYVNTIGPGRQYDAILLDIDHAPDCWLDPKHRQFYTPDGLKNLAQRLCPGGVFALWSAWKPELEFIDLLGGVFQSVQTHEISFYNPHINQDDSNWVITMEKRKSPTSSEHTKNTQ
ncbi:MAG TPA: spermidine synthase [Phycisphaerales bacterium]|nr:spermidine synthase [Phycisphaerales bacterium]